SLISDPIDMPAGVAGQVWHNDNDLQFASVERDFTNGTVSFAAGDLIFGVTYAVTIYNVAGHTATTAFYTAGTDRDASFLGHPPPPAFSPAGTAGDASFVVDPVGTAALALAFVSTQLGTPTPSGEVVFVLNQPVELDPLATSDSYLRSLEANFTIDSPDANM